MAADREQQVSVLLKRAVCAGAGAGVNFNGRVYAADEALLADLAALFPERAVETGLPLQTVPVCEYHSDAAPRQLSIDNYGNFTIAAAGRERLYIHHFELMQPPPALRDVSRGFARAPCSHPRCSRQAKHFAGFEQDFVELVRTGLRAAAREIDAARRAGKLSGVRGWGAFESN